MGSTVVFTIGELARRTGLPVKTIRFYSDEGLLPPTGRTGAGYRLYDTTAMARLELVRTLRELGLGLADVELVLTSESTVRDLAARHIDALDEQIRRLRLRRAVLRAVAKRNSPVEEVKLMNRLASMSDEERKRLLDEFWTEMVDGLDVDSALYNQLSCAKPDLPDDPAPEQLEAWIEFAELVTDPTFRKLIRGMGERQSAQRQAGEYQQPTETQQEQWVAWSSRAQAAVDAGLAPDSPEGRALAETIFTTSASPGRDPLDPAYRTEVTEGIAAGADPRAEHYWTLLGVINGWPPFPSQAVTARWIIDALTAAR
ncbi:helix-turn-helix domain-containing protein [Amycolatopsis sp. H20-H5]|uniref:helix-turn-helix domain-containing protein n=1 Tax=Amycolatopsis sp. H20-H5 TaxID=3046309 RepID=UPI002DBAAAD9|nr:MerR family transcriptional regulator [Amycolatopsis sp. H20-H5]MEC3981439.1 MerR family transcriptional regulator [Amycolatopsis sp. H20-H5]